MQKLSAVPTSNAARVKWTIAFAIWLCVIWGHSLMAGDLSSFESSRFVFLVRPFFELFGCHDEMIMTFFIRKTAHFSEYAILAIIATAMFTSWFGNPHKVLPITILVLIVVPCIDEFIQLHVPNRAGAVADVLLDICGGMFGLAIALLIAHGQRKRHMHE